MDTSSLCIGSDLLPTVPHKDIPATIIGSSDTLWASSSASSSSSSLFSNTNTNSNIKESGNEDDDNRGIPADAPDTGNTPDTNNSPDTDYTSQQYTPTASLLLSSNTTNYDHGQEDDDYVLVDNSISGTIALSTPFTPRLPSELILSIFRFLQAAHDLRSAILVCKLWCSCGMDLLWSKPTLLTLPVAERLVETMSLPKTIFPYANYIRRLNLSFLAPDMTDTMLIKFASCNRLERLLLAGNNKTTLEGLQRVLSGCPRLYSLDLSDIPAVTDALIEYVAENCPRLHTLYVGSCSSLTDDSIVKLAKSCRHLKRIKLSQCTLLTDHAVLALTEHCPHLIEIDLTNCNLKTDTAIQSIFGSLPQIRDINMTLLTHLTNAAFDSINPKINRFEQLRVLNFTSCANITDSTLHKIIPAAPRLRSLALTKCDKITDAGASVIKTLGKHLHYLHLGHCAKITDQLIVGLSQHCTRIRYLDLACCTRITDISIFALAQLPKLRRIGLVKCSNITDNGIYAMLVSQLLPQTLERVHLSYCVNLSDTAIASLVTQCRKMTHLSLTGVPAFIWPRYQKFCRAPPPEFTAHQREVFCVFSGKGVRDLRKYMQENVAIALAPVNLAGIRANYRMMSSAMSSVLTEGTGAEGSDSVVPLMPSSEEAIWAQIDAAIEMVSSGESASTGTPAQMMVIDGQIEAGPTLSTLPQMDSNTEQDPVTINHDDIEDITMGEHSSSTTELVGELTTSSVPLFTSNMPGPLVFRTNAELQNCAFRDPIPSDDGFPSLQHPSHSHHRLHSYRELELVGPSIMEMGIRSEGECSRVPSPGTLARSLNREIEGSGAGSTSPTEEEEDEEGEDDDDF